MASSTSRVAIQKSIKEITTMITIKKYTTIARVSLSNAIAYRATLFSRFCFYALFIYVFVNLWRAIYQEGSVFGYSYIQIVWYLILTELIAFACGTDILNRMNEDVRSGAIAYQIGRPMHYVFYQLSTSLGQIALNLVGFGALAVILGFIFVGQLYTFSIINLPLILLSIFTGILLNYFFLMLIGLSSFIMEDNLAIYLLFRNLTFMLGMFLPVEFLPGWLQPIAKSLPFSYVYWAPAKLFVDFSPALFMELFPRQIFWTALIGILVMFSYRISIRRLSINGG